MSKSKKTEAKTVKIKQVKSENSCTQKIKGTLMGLGLYGINTTRVLDDSPSVRGMIKKVSHLIQVIND